MSQIKPDASQKIFHVDQHLFHEFKVGDELSDVTIKFGRSSIRCHKRVLEDMSSFFKSNFTTNLKGNKTDLVDLK